MKLIKNNLTLILIFLFALSLRLFALGQIPRGITPDEVVQAYSAYSLLKTGQDEWGRSWPLLSFKSFLDYKAPLQTYLMIPSIAIFGLNSFATRLPSAVFGSLAIISIYFLAKEIFPKKPKTALFTALILAITPWHIQFSRTALEANLISFLFPLGLFAFLKGLKNHRWYYLTAVSWGLSLYAYHSIKIFLPLFILSLIILYFSKLKTHLNQLIFPIILFAILASPIYLSSFFGTAGNRASDLLISNFSVEQLNEISSSQYYSPLQKINPNLPRIFSNKLTFTIDKFIENYISYYTPSFWFTEGGREITYSIIPGRGLLYLWQLPFILFALFHLVTKPTKNQKIIFLWLILAALPASITKEGYRPNRASMFLGIWSLLTAYGLTITLRYLKPKFKSIFTIVLIPIVIISLIFYLNDYFFTSFIKYPTAMSYGWESAINHLSSIKDQYSCIYIEKGSQSQTFPAFYLKIDPKDFQIASQQWDQQLPNYPHVKYLDQLPKYSLNQYIFTDFNSDIYTPDCLYLSHKLEHLPSNRQTLYTVTTPDQKPIIEIFNFPQDVLTK